MTSNTKPAPSTYTIDATDRTLGRVASEAASALLGKKSVHFAKNQALPIKVTVENAGKMHLPARRVEGKVYTRYTGYPGGLYSMSMKEMIAKKGIAEVLKKTIDGMIPRNKLRTPRMKNLIVTE
ncbi:50S ribosomal protein L13 [Candidatus Kaiserbacteria bacterium RIFCSPLOWO2_01_FULL_55_19]|uniref:50S ribosomal protein L13 n=1 Tax=Candidatus Kaiserbacteria bacterium RIFCSPLOWO2_01_FULL_55_19 TaxID=1798516 RepID=A0A1F6ESQ4_9BACT|nr:MAG: 50S ribosomal protein L13 [Candidatus Kaiserbacteria bacterium RIFCSPLOWO2_01_FULL_55_19]